MAKIFGVHTPLELKNNLINGALDFWQAVDGATTTVNTASTQTIRTADMTLVESGGATTKNYSVVRSTDIPSLAQSGFQGTYSYLFTMITGIASPAAGDYVIPFEYRMEGLDYAKLHAGQATFGFWVKASVAGTYSFTMINQATNRSYVTTFTCGSVTWEYKTISVTLDNTGTWLFDNSASFFFYIGAIAGATFSTSSLNTWQSGNFMSATTSTNYQATNGATLQVTQLSMVQGPLGLGAKGFVRCGKDIAAELAMCQRYLQALSTTPEGQLNNAYAAGFAATTTSALFYIKFFQTMRANPSMIATASNWAVQRNGGGTVTATTIGFNNVGTNSGRLGLNVAAGLTAGEGLIMLSLNNTGMLLDARL